MNASSPPVTTIIIDDDNDDSGQVPAQAQPAQAQPAQAQAQQATVANSECVICMEPYVDGGEHKAAVLKCGHWAGEPCLKRWLATSKRCPTCRKSAKARDIVTVFNLPTVVSGSGAPGPPPAAAADSLDLAAKELLLQAMRRKATEAEQEAQRKAEEAKQHERESKRLKRELDDTLQQMAALQKAAQVLASAQPAAVPAANAPAPPQPRQHPGQQGHLHSQGWATQQTAYGLGPHGPHPPQTQPHHEHNAIPGSASHAPHGAMSAPALAPHAQHLPQPPMQHHPAFQAPIWGHYNDAPHSAPPPAGQGHQRGGHGRSPGATQMAPTPQPASTAALGMGGGGGRGGGAVAANNSGCFERLFSIAVEGCRLLALDVAGSRLMASESPAGGVGASCIRKVSLLSQCWTRIRLPASAGIVLDMQLQPAGSFPAAVGSLAAVVTRGAGLCLVSPQSDNVVATFGGLPHRPASCCWMPLPAATAVGTGAAGGGAAAYGEHLLVAGLEKGHIALLDTRRTDRPVAVAPVLQGAPRGCGQLPVRTVAALPARVAEPVAAAGGALWPAVALSCTKGAWLMAGGGEARDGGGGAAPALMPLDGGFGAGGMQLESLAVLGAPGGDGAGCARAALSWRPADGAHASGPAGAPGPRHEIGVLSADPRAPYWHEMTVQKYSRRGIQSVRSCLLPAPLPPGAQPHLQPGGAPQPPLAAAGGLQLASSDDDARRPLIWSLSSGGGGAWPSVAQWLEPHPEPPACMAAAVGPGAGGGAVPDCYLGCASQSLVVVYRRRGG